MKTSILTLSLTTALMLTACSNTAKTEAETIADTAKVEKPVEAQKPKTKTITYAACPADKTISDQAAFADDAPDAMDDFAAWHKKNGERAGVVTTKTGLQYKVVQEGLPGSPSPIGSQRIKVNYHGFFPNGDVFDSSYERGEPISFPANGVIKGWIEAMGAMQPCEARILYIPGNLAYGPNGRGTIPPNATLLFNVQLLGVQQ